MVLVRYRGDPANHIRKEGVGKRLLIRPGADNPQRVTGLIDKTTGYSIGVIAQLPHDSTHPILCLLTDMRVIRNDAADCRRRNLRLSCHIDNRN